MSKEDEGEALEPDDREGEFWNKLDQRLGEHLSDERLRSLIAPQPKKDDDDGETKEDGEPGDDGGRSEPEPRPKSAAQRSRDAGRIGRSAYWERVKKYF